MFAASISRRFCSSNPTYRVENRPVQTVLSTVSAPKGATRGPQALNDNLPNYPSLNPRCRHLHLHPLLAVDVVHGSHQRRFSRSHNSGEVLLNLAYNRTIVALLP